MSIFLNKFMLKDKFDLFRHDFLSNVLLLSSNLIIHLALRVIHSKI
jgi:hypothetical protein